MRFESKFVIPGLFVLALIFVFLFPPNSWGQEKYYVSGWLAGSLPLDDVAGTHSPGFGFSVVIDRQISDKLTMGVSYFSTKLWGETPALDLQIEDYDLTSIIYLKSIGNKWNLFLTVGSGWSLINTDNQTKENNFATLIGFGYQRMLYADIFANLGFLIRDLGDNVKVFSPYLNLKFPLPL